VRSYVERRTRRIARTVTLSEVELFKTVTVRRTITGTRRAGRREAELMTRGKRPACAGYDALRLAVAACLHPEVLLATAATAGGADDGRERAVRPPEVTLSSSEQSDRRGTSSHPPGDEADALRLAALVDLARHGDSDAFGQLYDYYSPSVYRFVYYRVSTTQLAEDLTSDTFFRALRSISSFQWQGKDFGAWLMTIARNLVVDHYKSARSRLETSMPTIGDRPERAANPEEHVVQALTNDLLRAKLKELPSDQQECLVLRFLNSYSIAETAKALSKSEGAVKQLQLRAIRNLARLMPEDVR
jgi:RNA polymerase sigma-70 factor, ECF subfamily